MAPRTFSFSFGAKALQGKDKALGKAKRAVFSPWAVVSKADSNRKLCARWKMGFSLK